jgi:hypothetical protein
METLTDTFVYKVMRVYNLTGKRDRYKTCQTYLEAYGLAQALNTKAEGTSFMFIIQSEPRRAK